jgi:hypothetical protein
MRGRSGDWPRLWRQRTPWSFRVVVSAVPMNNVVMADIPHPENLGREELRSLLKRLTTRESAVSDERRALHAQIDALRHELVGRLRTDGQIVISGAEVVGPDASRVQELRDTTPAKGADRGVVPAGSDRGVREAGLRLTPDGLIPVSPGWFVLNATQARWCEQPGQGHGLPLTGLDESEAEALFPMLGMALRS